MLNICRQLFDIWNSSVLYCHWKGNEPIHLEKGLDGKSDMDVLLDLADKEKGHESLRSLHFIPCKSQFGSRYPEVEDWVGYDKNTGKLVHLHLHFELVTGHDGLKEYNLPWKKEALESRKYDESTGIYVMNPNLELITLYTRICLKSKAKHILKVFLGKYNIKNGFKKDPTDEINFLKNCVDWTEIDNILCRYYPQKYISKIRNGLQLPELDSSSFLSLFTANWNVMRKFSRYNVFTLIFMIPFYAIMLRLIGLMRRHGIKKLIYRKVKVDGVGLSVAFLGQDGSGKSTITCDILKWLTWKLDTRIFYFGSGEQYNPWEKKFNSKIKGSSFLGKAVKRVLSVLVYLKWGKYVLNLAKNSSRYISKGGIAIYDRFPQIQYLGINDGPKIRTNVFMKMNSRLLNPLVKILCGLEEKSVRKVTTSPPNVVIKLMLSPEESIRRKPLEKLENVKQKHEIIKNLKFEDSSVYEIDATQDYQEELLQIKSIIWKHLIE